MRTGLAHQDARDDFDRARRRASWAQLTGWLQGHRSNRLPVLGEVMTTSATAGPTVRRLEYERAGDSDAVVPVEHVILAGAAVEVYRVHSAAGPDADIYPLKARSRHL